jgi:hypothetical protein
MTMTAVLTGVFVLGLPAWLLVEELAYRFGTRRPMEITGPASATAPPVAAPALRQPRAA